MERREREEERWPRSGCRGGATAVSPNALLHGIRRRGVGDRHTLSFVLPFVISLVRAYSFLGQAWADIEGELATCPSRGQRNASMIKQEMCRTQVDHETLFAKTGVYRVKIMMEV